MAVATGLAVDDLIGLDDDVRNTVAVALSERWTNIEELLAINAEATDRLYRAFIAAWSDKKTDMPEPLRIERPGAVRPPEKPAVSIGALARQMTRR